jgi:hypothetical protein
MLFALRMAKCMIHGIAQMDALETIG